MNAPAVLGVSASMVWIVGWAMIALHRRQIVRLADLPAAEPAGGWPSVAVIFAARDEAPHVERAARSMLAQDYPELEVIAVDDRSTDGTGEVLDRLATEEGRLRVVHIERLPAGWLGKLNALQGASEAAPADWLLFTDGDVVLGPTAIRRAIAHAIALGADHLTVAPKTPAETVGERLFLAMFLAGLTIGYPLPLVHDRRSRRAIGVGAFNLVRAEAFRAIGGFERIRMSVDDDMILAAALKGAGGRTRLVLAGDEVVVKWQSGLIGHVRGMEKNLFAVAGYRLSTAVFIAATLLWLGAAPHLGLFVGPWWSRAICAAGIGAIAAALGVYSRQNNISPGYALAMPISAAIFSFALFRSTWLTLRRGGVRWRDSFYPLAELRRHRRLRQAWLREVWKSTR